EESSEVDKHINGMKKFSGRSTQNKLVHFEAPADLTLVGKTVSINITKAFPAVFRGEYIGRIN
ncbi:MAG: hypothetical protein L6Q37_08220, partial [Bdellovibrionaceae bacterium]|nr:hypothetical protein [Pseudobdellovibrionaceae bacterium]